MNILQLTTRLSARVGAFIFCLAALPAWSTCQPDPGAPPPESPYLGYTPAGYKGSLERDPVWHRLVRGVKKRDSADSGATMFELKRRPGVRFTSIEPIDLGAGARGFLAMRDGCGQLLDQEGKAYPTPFFNSVQWEPLGSSEVLAPGRALLRLQSDGDYVWALFERGRLLAVSPQPYVMTYAHTEIKTGFYLPSHLRHVAARSENANGIVDLRSLKEVLAPVWSGVAGLTVVDDTRPVRYLVGARDSKMALFAPEGGDALLDGISSLEVISNWFPFRKGRPAVDGAVLLLRMDGETSCRLLDMQLRPLLPHPLAFRDDQCVLPRTLAGHQYLFIEPDQKSVQTYAIEPEGRLRRLSSTSGQLAGADEHTGLVVVRVQTDQEVVHHLYFADGARIDEEDYTEFQNLGCRHRRVKLRGQWLSLLPDGRTSSRLTFPVSC